MLLLALFYSAFLGFSVFVYIVSYFLFGRKKKAALITSIITFLFLSIYATHFLLNLQDL